MPRKPEAPPVERENPTFAHRGRARPDGTNPNSPPDDHSDRQAHDPDSQAHNPDQDMGEPEARPVPEPEDPAVTEARQRQKERDGIAQKLGFLRREGDPKGEMPGLQRRLEELDPEPVKAERERKAKEEQEAKDEDMRRQHGDLLDRAAKRFKKDDDGSEFTVNIESSGRTLRLHRGSRTVATTIKHAATDREIEDAFDKLEADDARLAEEQSKGRA